VTLKTTEPAATPALRTLSLRFQTANLPPEISKLEAPDLASGDGGTKQAKLNFRWEASDPNGDDLQYVVEIRKEGWPGWVRLTEQPTTDKTHAIETASLPAGEYRVRLTADDRLSNNAGDALTDDRVSDRFLIDATPPSVNLKADGTKVTAVLKDASTRIARASYSVDGKPWVSVFAEDGLFDTAEEALSLTFPDLTPGAHVLVVRASDAAGNVGTADLLLTVP
jgi:hypothetical protein